MTSPEHSYTAVERPVFGNRALETFLEQEKLSHEYHRQHMIQRLRQHPPGQQEYGDDEVRCLQGVPGSCAFDRQDRRERRQKEVEVRSVTADDEKEDDEVDAVSRVDDVTHQRVQYGLLADGLGKADRDSNLAEDLLQASGLTGDEDGRLTDGAEPHPRQIDDFVEQDGVERVASVERRKEPECVEPEQSEHRGGIDAIRLVSYQTAVVFLLINADVRRYAVGHRLISLAGRRSRPFFPRSTIVELFDGREVETEQFQSVEQRCEILQQHTGSCQRLVRKCQIIVVTAIWILSVCRFRLL